MKGVRCRRIWEDEEADGGGASREQRAVCSNPEVAPGLTLTADVVKQFTKTANAVEAAPWHLARASEWLKTICLNTPLTDLDPPCVMFIMEHTMKNHGTISLPTHLRDCFSNEIIIRPVIAAQPSKQELKKRSMGGGQGGPGRQSRPCGTCGNLEPTWPV